MSCGDDSGILQKERELVRVTVFISPFSLEIVVCFSFLPVYTVDFWCVYMPVCHSAQRHHLQDSSLSV